MTREISDLSLCCVERTLGAERTAIAVVESYRATAEELPGVRTRYARRPKYHELVHLEKLPSGLTYPAHVEAILATVDSLAGSERSVRPRSAGYSWLQWSGRGRWPPIRPKWPR